MIAQYRLNFLFRSAPRYAPRSGPPQNLGNSFPGFIIIDFRMLFSNIHVNIVLFISVLDRFLSMLLRPYTAKELTSIFPELLICSLIAGS